MLALGLVMGLVHALLITKLQLQPFTSRVRPADLSWHRALVHGDGTAGFGFGVSFPELEWLTTGRSFGIPHSLFALILVAAVMWVVLHRSVFGRYLYAVGKNEEAARYSGIPPTAWSSQSYMICGLLTAISAIFFAMYTRSISPSSHGNFYELYAIAASVLGRLLAARRRRVAARLWCSARILLQVLQNLVNLLGIPSFAEFRG
jgi:ribose transport system permease protein